MKNQFIKISIFAFVLLFCLVSCSEDDAINELNSPKVPSSIQTVHDFEVGLRFCDKEMGANVGLLTYANSNSGTWTNWISDNNQLDPDGARIALRKDMHSIVSFDKDFRIVAYGIDGDPSTAGTPVSTPWASEGGGWSDYISDNNLWGPNKFKLKIETRNWPNPSLEITDFRLGIQVIKGGSSGIGSSVYPGLQQYTSWMNEISEESKSEWSYKSDRLDAIKIHLDVRRH